MTELEKIRSQAEAYEAMAAQLRKCVNDLEAIETKASTERWKPKHQESYFYIDSTHEIIQEINGEDEVFDLHFKSFNAFKTQEEAKKERDIRQVWYELREFARKANNIQGKVMDRYSVEIHGVKFISSKDLIEAQRHFGDRLNLLNF